MAGSIPPHMLVSVDKSVVSCELEDGAALLDMRSGTYFGLNAVALHIWTALQQPRRVDEIASSVTAAYDVDETTALQDTQRILARLADAGLIHVAPDQTA